MDLEDVCVQLKNRYRDDGLVFQGQAVRLKKNQSVCRQLYEIWLESTGRDATYEDFKKSLRFDQNKGHITVKLAYDPTKFVVAGLAGLGAAASGYHWWKSRKNGAGSPSVLLSPDSIKLTEDDQAKIKQESEEFSTSRMLDVENTNEKTNEVIRQLRAGSKPLSDNALARIETGWRLRKAPRDLNTYLPPLVLENYQFHEGKLQDIQKPDNETEARKLNRTEYFSDEVLTNVQLPETENGSSNRVEVILTNADDICSQVVNAIYHGITRTVGTLANKNDLFFVKTKQTTKYKIPPDNNHLHVEFFNLTGIQNKSYKYCDFIVISYAVYEVTYDLVRVTFSDTGFAFLFSGQWIYVNPKNLDNWPEKLLSKISGPSQIESIPKCMIFKKRPGEFS